MRKIILLVIVALIGLNISAQGFLRDRARTQTYSLTADDTMRIYADDRIAGVTIVVPTGATDSVWVLGETGTLDGNSTGYIKFAPGDEIGFGYDDKLKLDSITIVVKDVANIITTPLKR